MLLCTYYSALFEEYCYFWISGFYKSCFIIFLFQCLISQVCPIKNPLLLNSVNRSYLHLVSCMPISFYLTKMLCDILTSSNAFGHLYYTYSLDKIYVTFVIVVNNNKILHFTLNYEESVLMKLDFANCPQILYNLLQSIKMVCGTLNILLIKTFHLKQCYNILIVLRFPSQK